MTINQLNAIGALPASSPSSPSARKVSAPNSDTALPPVSTVESKVNSNPQSEEQINQAVQKIQGTVDNLAHNLRFSIDEDTGKTIIKVMDVHTEEVIRQIPSEEAVEIARTLDKVQGLLFNGKA
ncbi:MAG: flagellar protein FlaG [Gammaproteobacteria bacterium]|nr:MAG: flagellar protein FlaG [Gammaproteobacteria bacterium]